ncbi:SLC13 family permease [Gordonibacter massiliensis (ex Traore et al. 2017)]|uniref:Citrate transporter n=1 Tax=Gordonibacter massiliensis (ex Traore et al. 2017) TaxID=1841863 RepID=A0A842JAE2_9ACTN|nr:SLC13 family permease [Gordonibacter massiliensis (ex Traore et al. 2017)]MBC2887756.1 citrate transporter [Gordonibacter massiliensis (ex Traore et al. 2017)]
MLAARLARFARERTVLVVSALAALATVPLVPPDEAYLGYFDLKTLACLFGILAVVGALRGIGLFEHAARLLVARFATCRSAVAALVGSTLVLSMFATNDLALIMMLPLSAATLLKAGWERSLPFAFIMQNLAANLGGMILPFGNPQNLYLYERFSIPLGDFLSIMAPPFAVSVALIALCCVLFVKPDAPRAMKKRATEERVAKDPRDGALSDKGELACADAPRVSSARRPRALAYAALLALVIASVFRLVPYPVAVGAVVVALGALDRRALRTVDWGLLLTFACFFVFAGNLARVPAVEAFFSYWMNESALLVGAGASQIISNFPAAVLLSHFTDSYAALLVGVNVGGAGTIVASLASLITFNEYRIVRRGFPSRPALARVTPGAYLARFTVYNAAFLAVLLLACAPFV